MKKLRDKRQPSQKEEATKGGKVSLGKLFSFSNGQRTGLLGKHRLIYYLLLPLPTVTCRFLGAATGERISLASLRAFRSVLKCLLLLFTGLTKCSRVHPRSCLPLQSQEDLLDEQHSRSQGWSLRSRRPWCCEHSSRGWQLEASIATGCDEEAEQRSTGVVVWISWAGLCTAPHHGLGKVPTC